MGEPAQSGSVPRLGKKAGQERVLKGPMAKVTRKLRKKSV